MRIVNGSARFTGPNSVHVDGVDGVEDIEFDAALIATGSRPHPRLVPARRRQDPDDRDCYLPKVLRRA